MNPLTLPSTPPRPRRNSRWTHWIAAAAMIAFAAPAANAQVFSGTYTFTGTTGNVASFDYNGDPITDLTVAPITKVGITTSSSTGNFRGTDWPTGTPTGIDTFTGSVDIGKYIEFTLAATPGKVINFPTITFGVGRSSTGPRQWQWRSSVDSYATPIPVTTVASGLTHSAGVLTNPDTNSSWTGNIIQTSGTAYENLSSITFRLYAYNAETTAGTAGLQGALTFGGTLAVDGGPPDTTPPVVVTRSPAVNSSGALTNTSLVLTFDEFVTPGTTGTIVIRKASAPLTAVETITLPDSKVTSSTVNGIINPAAILEPGVEYYVELTVGTFTDTVGNAAPAISGSTAWNFTTRAAPTLVISQYYEGTGSNKFIELKNLSSQAIDLADYRLAVWADANREGWKSGSGTTTLVTELSGEIPANGFFLIADSAAITPVYAASNNDLGLSGVGSAVSFNGDDSVVLYSGTGTTFTQNEVLDAVSFVAFDGADKSFYRLSDGPGFDFAQGSSILDYSDVWATKTNAEVDSASPSDDWFLQGSQPISNLTLSISPTSFAESGGTATATVTRDGSPAANLIVSIVNSNPGAAKAVDGLDQEITSFDIPATQTSAQFTIKGIDNAELTGDALVTFTVSALGYLPASQQVTVEDDPTDLPLASVSLTASPYAQNFDSLGIVAFPDAVSSTIGTQTSLGVLANPSLNGWYVTKIGGSGTIATGISPDDGTSISGLVNNYGATDASDRALGLLASGSNIMAMGALITNNTGGTLTGLNLSMTGEFWRSSTAEQNTLTFGYGKIAGVINSLNFLSSNDTGVLPFSGLDIVGPPFVTTNAALDGNDVVNQLAFTNVSIPLTLAPGESAFIRWQDTNNGGSDAGLAIDNLTITGVGTSPGNTFASWIGSGSFDFSGFTNPDLTATGDPDNDGIANSLENIFGTSPAVASQGLTAVSASGGNLVFRHTLSATPASDLTGSYEWSTNLADWNASGATVGGITVTFGIPSVITPGTPNLVQVTATVTGTAAKVFARFKVTQP